MAGNGIALAARTPKPIYSKKATKLIRPPKGVTAFGVALIRTFISPNNGVNAEAAVLWAVFPVFFHPDLLASRTFPMTAPDSTSDFELKSKWKGSG